MEKIIAKCGYRCDLCPAYETNLKGEADKQRMSEIMKQYFECDMSPEMVRPCKGCQAAAQAPDPNCPVYPCAMERRMENCGHCADFGCEKLKARMDVVEECLSKHPDMPKEDFEVYFKPFLSREILTRIHESMES